ncbi:hypothetical protein EW146_g8768 [Bondarzewia mesenterica]|uniref:Uncharacterized protein n=1 Tax=Bondarzewia mesenterica TaxID=1095465 RepID=A0A4S4LH84_9AGAM|nr:hypothetical protein EW146_g8768 [Bondarzewia mesenterica]
MVVTGRRDGCIDLLASSSGALTKTLKGHTGTITSLSFSPDGTQLASTADEDAHIRLWDIARGRCTVVLKCKHNGVRASSVQRAIFLDNGERLLSHCLTPKEAETADHATREKEHQEHLDLWDIKSKTFDPLFVMDVDFVFAVSPQLNLFLVGAMDKLHWVDLKTKKIFAPAKGTKPTTQR